MKKEQSLAGVIRERLESIEQRLAVGVRQEVLLAELAEAGYETSLSNFRNELWRARKRKEQSERAVPGNVAESKSAASQAEPKRVAPVPTRQVTPVTAGKTLTEQVVSSENKSFSFKQMQKAKEQK